MHVNRSNDIEFCFRLNVAFCFESGDRADLINTHARTRPLIAVFPISFVQKMV